MSALVIFSLSRFSISILANKKHFYFKVSNNHPSSNKLHFIMLAKKDNLMLFDNQFKALKLLKNRARGNRKALKRPKTMSKINFRNLKLKS